jgi:hypothetical protein
MTQTRGPSANSFCAPKLSYASDLSHGPSNSASPANPAAFRIVDWALIAQREIAACRLRLPPQSARRSPRPAAWPTWWARCRPSWSSSGHQVTVYLPFYARVRRLIEGEPNYAVRSITIPFRHYNRFVGVVDGGKRDGVQYYFIDCPELFDRKELYGAAGVDYADNAERFGLFCRAVIEASKLLGVPNVFHVHDWQAALIPVYLRTTYLGDPVLRSAATVLTIHNAAFPGQVSARDHRATALSVGAFHHGSRWSSSIASTF